MRTSIDAAGRVVVPKSLRDALGLSPGAELDVTIRDGAIVLEPPPTAVKLVRRGKGLVAVPDKPLPTLTADEVRATLEATRR